MTTAIEENERDLKVFLAFTFFMFVHVAVASEPKTISLDGDWEFYYHQNLLKNGNKLIVPEDKHFEGTMVVPGYWDDHLEKVQTTSFWSNAKCDSYYRPIDYPMGNNPPDASLPYLVGTGYYRKYFEATSQWHDKIVVLHVGGVCKQAWVWLNGDLIEHHVGHETPFDIRLNPNLKTGKNELVIAVENIMDTKHLGCNRRGYKANTGGIYRSVNLEITNAPRISDLYLYPLETTHKIRWNIELDGVSSDENVTLHWLIRNPESGEILDNGQRKIDSDFVKWDMENPGMQQWSEHLPHLYDIEVSTYNNGILADRKKQSFGLRKLERRGINLFLNDRPIMLRGVCDMAYFAKTCTPPIDVELYRDMLRKYKKIGFNWLRFHTTVPHEEYMQAADELGMIIQVEAPFGRTNTPEDDLKWSNMIRTCRKHPSVVLYCRGNEEMLDWPIIETIVRWGNICHREAPDALFNPMEYLWKVVSCLNYSGLVHGPKPDGLENEDPNELVQEPLPHNIAKLNRLREVSDVFSPKSRGSTLSSASVYWEPERCNELSFFERPLLMHEFGIQGNYLNLDLEHRYEGTRIGTDLYASIRRNLQKAGLLHNAALYYQNSCKWQELIRKHSIENARKCEYIAGYDYLGGIDSHWHRSGYACGIMNEFFELKPGQSIDAINMYNGQSVILLNTDNNRNLTMGSIFSASLLSSLYGFDSLEQGNVTWHTQDSQGHILNRGRFQVDNIRNGKIETLGEIEFKVPCLTKASKITLLVHLSGGEYEIDNQWDFWIFPKVDKIKTYICADETVLNKFSPYCTDMKPINLSDKQSLRVVSSMSSETLDFLATGGKVILLGADTFPQRKTRFQIGSAGRVASNLATVIRDHPLMQKFPHEGYCDWQFCKMFEADAVVFNNMDVPFNPILEIVSSYKLILKQAGIFELSVGEGKLLVCTLTIETSDTAGIFLFNEMLKYVSGENFKPETSITPEKLTWMLKKDFKTLQDDARDNAYDPRVQDKKY